MTDNHTESNWTPLYGPEVNELTGQDKTAIAQMQNGIDAMIEKDKSGATVPIDISSDPDRVDFEIKSSLKKIGDLKKPEHLATLSYSPAPKIKK